MRVAAYTLGCKVNQYDTNAMLELLQNEGFETVAFHEPADVYLINTCTVTNTADKKSRNMIRRIHHLYPQAMICVCGCLAQRDCEAVLAMEGVGAVIGTKDRANIGKVVRECLKGKNASAGLASFLADEAFEELSVRTSGEMTRGYLKIQEGCNNFCSYCIIPYVRGRVRSRKAAAVIHEAQALVQNGVKEVVLTGIHISSYGQDTGEKLAELLVGLNGIDGLERIRLGSLEPHLLTDEFVSAMKDLKKVCPHFHVSLQSGSDSILKKMNRKYTAEEYAHYIEIIRNYYEDPAIMTDIITGFPGETETHFGESCDFVSKIGFSRIHVFPYSQREGTPAAKMEDQVPMQIRRQRAAHLIAVGKKAEEQYIKRFLGTRQTVLFEQITEDGLAEGYTDRYLRVRAQAQIKNMGQVLLADAKDDIIYGNLIK
ncbi:MAG: tRNA (N(6)-L-threonylcarbamoyladenosine(37)-C(2))-methylthiotransferase MtaB [Christensenella sp.]|nr:tRNA (N(6)-L-threonylcarbamoyladenosine(37)-C(2))-methylthiotransferase MtaB [Christensenella sp.]